MSTQTLRYRAVSLALLFSLLLSPLSATATPISKVAAQSATSTAAGNTADLYRTQITVNGTLRWQRLEELQVVTLSKQADQAVVLVDAAQLETLARLGFIPTATEALTTLATTAATEAPWLAWRLQPLLQQAAGVQAANATQASQTLQTAMQALTTETRTALATTSSIDDDGDGLTNTQESWWCTDPLNPDSDGDGAKDGVEVAAAKAWLANTASAPPATGKPFSGWPATKTGCPDDDQDSVPDLAERWELGLNLNRESTDRDKFDDGQELFGNTYCPGSGGFCGYGALPRNEDWGVIFAEMPAWVRAPGNHPLVAAFPKPEVDVVESSFHLQTVTVVTTDHVISQGTERTYSTAKTEGTSTSVANTKTWNNWQEVSVTEPVFSSSFRASKGNVQTAVEPISFTGMLGTAATFVGGKCLVDGAVEIFAGEVRTTCEKIYDNQAAIGSSIVTGATTAAREFGYDPDADLLQNAWNLSKCALNSTGILPGQGQCFTNGLAKGAVDFYNDLRQRNAQNAIQDNTSDPGGNGTHIEESYDNGTPVVNAYPRYEINFPVTNPLPVKTETTSTGSSTGGAITTSTSEYEEHTVTNGEAFSNGESWGNATAQDSAHAADLWFTYRVRNTGTEYAREIGDLTFNLYIGDPATGSGQAADPAYTYFVANDIGGDGKFHNFMPNEQHPYTSQRIPLTLAQMKAIDLGGPIRIVVEDFTYGIDELFYQDAANAGVLIAMEDGTDDGDESIDPYLLPTWGDETALDVLARYFPHETDADGTITAIWTPEYRSDTPAWCQAGFRPSGASSLALWCKHALSTADWWNIYTNGLGDGTEGFQETPATPGAVALFRFNKDSDLDGFSDRSEIRLGTLINDPTDFPRPEVLAGVHSSRSGNEVVATLSLLNRGLYDAYGVEAIMVAPDDSVSITNNTVGGSGRVRALNQVIVGSRIALPSPLPAGWSQANHATPAAGGYFTGAADRAYTLTVNCANPGGCAVGSGTLTVGWADDGGGSGTLDFGTGYASPTFLPVGALGVSFALYSGTVSNGESLTITAHTPRDTFQYTINSEPYTEPLVIVSYNDPQGNHRFIVPPTAMQLTTPNDDLTAFSGTMLQDVGVEIVTTAAFAPGANATDLLINNPAAITLTDAHLFLEFIDPAGTVVHEATSQATLPPGPSYVTVNWDSASFTPAYDNSQDYIVLAFLTDYAGNILDTGGRPLSSFQADPLPTLVTDDAALTWDFGAVAQGALLRHRLSMANTGFGPLYTFVDAGGTLALSQAGQRTVGAAGVADYQLTLRTADLPVGPYDETFTIKTSDPANPTRTFHVVGTISAPDETPAGAIQRPLDVPVTVTGPKNQGELITFPHTLGPDAATLHPVKIFNDDYSVLKGVGEYATDFAAGTAAADMFGDGRDGVMPSSGNLDNDNGSAFGVVNSGTQGSLDITVTDAYGVARINPGDVVLIHQTQGTNAGCWEVNKAVSDFAGNPTINTYQLETLLQCDYSSSSSNRAQIVRVPQYTTCDVTGTVTPIAGWNGNWGGILAVMCQDTMNIAQGGTISARGTNGSVVTGSNSNYTANGGSGYGFKGGSGFRRCCGDTNGAWQGDSVTGIGSRSRVANGNGGGAAYANPDQGHAGGGGGGNGTGGSNGFSNSQSYPGGAGGSVFGTADLQIMSFGGGGGGGNTNYSYGVAGGGSGGGIIFIAANAMNAIGQIDGGGGTGGNSDGAGGGGAGGSIFVRTRAGDIGTGRLTAQGGAGGNAPLGTAGSGGSGRIHIEYCESLSGTTTPAANAQKLNCYIAEQGAIASNLFGTGNDGDITINTTTTFNVPRSALVSTASVGQTTVNLVSSSGLSAGDEVVIIQIQGTGTGNYELGRILSVAGSTLTLEAALQHTYTQGGSSKAQLVRVPNYDNVTVTGSGRWEAPAWNGSTGGIITFRASGEVTIDGTVIASQKGFRGGSGGTDDSNTQGEGYPGTGSHTSNANGNGGGGGHAAPGGGGGYGTAGAASVGTGGSAQGGNTAGDAELTQLFFGGGGGGGGSNGCGGTGGGYGGGIILMYAKALTVNSRLDSRGGQGGDACERAGGGGAGGAIKLIVKDATIGTSNHVFASGERGGFGSPSQNNGGQGGNGRVRIEYCTSLSGVSVPAASTQQIDCYIAQQGETGTASFLLPEAVPSSATYNVQFGRKLDYAAAGEQISILRVPAGLLQETYLDLLISGVGVGSVTASVDIGNDGSWDWTQSPTADGAVALTSTNLAAAFNAYWAGHGSPTSGTLDIPLKVSLSKGGQVLLTNLQTSTAASGLRAVQIPAATYQSVLLDLTAGSSGAGTLGLALDVGDNGSIEWSHVANHSFPAALTTANLAAAFNSYLSGHSGVVNVPVRIYGAPQLPVALREYSAVVDGTLDLVAQSVSAPSPSDEGATVTLQATVRNNGNAASGPLTAAFFATLPDWGDWYIGSAFLADLAANATNNVALNWETTGFRGAVPVKVVVTPYDPTLETTTNNNLATATLAIQARPDLQVTALTLSDEEPLAGETVNVTLDLQNQGAQSAGSQTTAIYSGNPDDGGVVLGTQSQGALDGGNSTTIGYPWTPTTPGLYRIFGRADRDNAVNEYDEGNNDRWRDLYVGLATPIYLDSGAATDVAYSSATGYGYVDEGQPDVITNCGTESHQTFRRDPDGRVIYRFDHLQPGHFYHLNLTMFECVAAGRSQSVYVDDNLVAGPEDLGDGQIHRLSIRLDPALYADRSVTISVEDPSIDGALVSEVDLVDVNYRYADAGGPNDSAYSVERGYGWLDGTASSAWGTLPYQSVRVDQADNELRYRFDNLAPGTSYKLNFTFWQPSGQERIQKVYANGIDMGVEVDTGDYQIHRISAPVPLGAYSDGDHSIVVSIKRLNGSSGAMVNEIALEAETVTGVGSCALQPTPYRMDSYGAVTIDGQPAPSGTTVEAVDPRGNVVGCFVVEQAGQYGFMPIYGEDTSRTPAIPGMRDGEMMLFKVNGIPSLATPKATWADGTSQQVGLNAGGILDQSIALRGGWNLFSSHIEPLLPPLRQALGSIDSRYDRVLSATEIYATTLDDVYNTLHTIQSGAGYYLRTVDSGTTYLLLQGVPQAVDRPLALQAGWNWIGYLPESSLPTATALQSIDGLYQRVLSLDKSYVPSLPSFSTLQSLEAGEGYLIFMDQAATLVYPTGANAAIQKEEVQSNRSAGCANLQPTPAATLLYGYLTTNGNPAPVGTIVEVMTPQQEVAGCFIVETPGQYGLMHVYGRDNTANPPIPGFVEGESLSLRVNGTAVATAAVIWSDDKAPHQLDLVAENVSLHQLYLPVITR